MSSAEPGYVELHAHSAFSFQDGASMPHELALRAAELGYDSFAITDHDSLAGALEFGHAANGSGIRPITGAEVTVVDPQLQLRHVTLIARTQEGYRNLCRLLTAAYAPRTQRTKVSKAGQQPPGRAPHESIRTSGSAERPNPMVDLPTLLAHAEGLTCLTGCARNGLVARYAESDQFAAAVDVTMQLQQGFSTEHVFVELQVLQHRGDAARNRFLARVAEQAGAGLVATGNVHAHDSARARLHDVLVAIRNHTTLEQCEHLRVGNLSLTLSSPGEVAARFAAYPEAVANSRRIADSVQFDIRSDPGYRYPELVDDDGTTADEQLARICAAQLDIRYAGRASHDEACVRLDEELAIIEKHGLAGFFLLHHDVLELAREVALEVRGPDSARATNPPGRGRGSSVESMVCYLTGLSHVDPVETNLRLGRFLNEELPSVPDIDLDFPRDIRHELLRRVVERYGEDRCAMVAAHQTYRTRSAIRDVGKALGLPNAELKRLAHRCDSWNAREIAQHVTETGPRWEALAELTAQIADLPRQIGQHSGGVIISTDSLCDIVPIQPAAMQSRQICQWDKDSCADAGFLKIDVLGLGMLSSVEECLETIAQVQGDRIDLSRIDYEDQAVFAQIQEGDTVGTFQIESRAQIASIQRVRPENLHDLTVQVAIVRPGPIQGGSVNPYIEMRKRLRDDPTAKAEYEHPLLEKALGETYGAVIFQDQVIEVAMAIGGFRAGEADALRRVMTRKRSTETIDSYRRQFVDGAARQGVSAELADRTFDRLLGFAVYGFPRAHSAAFAVLGYQSAWLRHYYPAFWYAALLNAQPVGFYVPDSLLRDADRHGVETQSVDVNLSSALCTARERALRIGLSYVNGLSYDDAVSLERERSSRGPFTDIADLARRSALRTDQIEAIVKSGATDCFDQPRREQLWQLGTVARVGSGGQEPLAYDAPDSPKLRQMELWEQVSADYDSLGLSVRAHPVELIRAILPSRVLSMADACTRPRGATVEVVGTSIAIQRPATAKGTIFMLLEDESGTLNVIVTPELYKQQRLTIRSERIVRVTGVVQRHEGVVSIKATDVAVLPAAMRKLLPAVQRGKEFC